MRVPLRPVLVDALLAVVLAVLAAESVHRQTAGGADWPAYLLVALSTAPLALRQRAPVTSMAVVVVALGLLASGYGAFPSGGIMVLVGMFTVATLRPRPVAAVVFGGATALTVGVLAGLPDTAPTDVVQAALVLVGAWTLGESTRRWSQRAERAAATAARAVADERVRIARELHDVVAHHMSVVSLQAGLAQYVLDADPPTARRALTAAGGAAREALGEMRRLLDVLRMEPGDDDLTTDPVAADPADPVGPSADYGPQPGLAELDTLVERTRAAGVPVQVVVTGPPRRLPPGPDLCAFRVVQESLTNVLKHAGPARVRIELDHREREVVLTVRDDGAGSGRSRPARATATGHGVRGMRERAELYGGELSAGPYPDGGFAVRLALPLDGADGW